MITDGCVIVQPSCFFRIVTMRAESLNKTCGAGGETEEVNDGT